MDSIEKSRKLLEAMWNMDGDTVAQGIDRAHQEISILKYNDENALSCTINLRFTLRENTIRLFVNCLPGKDLRIFA